jgi:nicotinate-nucleotide adenylyltransferase
MKIGLFGGTFDPIHLGHLILAERVRDEAQLDEVWFLVSYKPPHKPGVAITRFEQRCEMVGLAITGQPAFRVEAIEKELPPPSYTANTLAELKERHAMHEFTLILGADSLVDLPTWYQPARVLEQAEILVVGRPNSPELSAENVRSLIAKIPQTTPARVRSVACPLVELASRELRERVAHGRSIRYLVPRAVEEYIRERKLYQTT